MQEKKAGTRDFPRRLLPKAFTACMIIRMTEKNPAAVALGRLGGKARVTKGFGTLSPEDRSAKAKEGALARWGKKKKAAAKKTRRKKVLS